MAIQPTGSTIGMEEIDVRDLVFEFEAEDDEAAIYQAQLILAALGEPIYDEH
jgi:hypothetical protein